MGNPRGFDPQWIHDETWVIWFPQTGAALKLELNLPRKLSCLSWKRVANLVRGLLLKAGLTYTLLRIGDIQKKLKFSQMF